MLKRVLILLVLALAQAGCSLEEGVGPYKPVELTDKARQELERDKREFLQIEDLKIGDGPLAAWGRRIKADIEVRYTDGTVIYRGPMYDYVGFQGSTFILDAAEDSGALVGQTGIWLGLNGMAVGEKRRITIEPRLVDSYVLISGGRREKPVEVHKEKLIVEAILTESCIPVLLHVPVLIHREVWCRSSETPKRDPAVPIWNVY